MKTPLLKLFFSLLLIFISSLQYTFAQVKQQSIIMVNGNVGYGLLSQFHTREVENSYEFQHWGNPMEAIIGLEVYYVHRTKLAFKGNVFRSGYIHSDYPDAFMSGYSIGIGIGKNVTKGEIEPSKTPLASNNNLGASNIITLSFGKSHSILRYANLEDSFGEISISPDTKEEFFADNYFLDICVHRDAGLRITKRQDREDREKNLFFLMGGQTGVIIGVNKSDWANVLSGEVAPGIEKTFPFGAYWKIQIGLAYRHRQFIYRKRPKF